MFSLGHLQPESGCTFRALQKMCVWCMTVCCIIVCCIVVSLRTQVQWGSTDISAALPARFPEALTEAEHWKPDRLQSTFSFSCLFAGGRWELTYRDVNIHFNQITDFNTLSGSKKRLMVLEYMQYSHIKAPAGINPFYDRQKTSS